MRFIFVCCLFAIVLTGKSMSYAQTDHWALYEEADKAQQEERYEDAIELYKQVLEVSPDFVNARFQLGIVYGAVGDFENSVKEFEYIYKLSPDDPEVMMVLGYTYAQNRQHHDAIRILKKLITKEPENDEARLILGTEYVLIDRNDKAVAQYDILVKMGSIEKANTLGEWLYLPKIQKKQTE